MREAIRVDNLFFSYPDDRQALKGVNMAVYEGETVAIIGPNGAGKSTLLLHFNGILKGQGRVSIFGRPVDEDLKWTRRKVGVVFQDPDDQLFSATVFDDVAFGLLNLGYPEDEVRRRVLLALYEVGLEGYEKRVPHHLSLGEKKKVALATVLALSPDILVFDEPTSNLDPRAKWSLLLGLKDLTQTKVFVSHDLEMVRELASRVIVLDEGKVVAEGRVEDILADRDLLRLHGLLPPVFSHSLSPSVINSMSPS